MSKGEICYGKASVISTKYQIEGELEKCCKIEQDFCNKAEQDGMFLKIKWSSMLYNSDPNKRWISFHMILGEKLEREENLEKKRKISKDREKSQKKRIFSWEMFFQRKFSFHFFVKFKCFYYFFKLF